MSSLLYKIMQLKGQIWLSSLAKMIMFPGAPDLLRHQMAPNLPYKSCNSTDYDLQSNMTSQGMSFMIRATTLVRCYYFFFFSGKIVCINNFYTQTHKWSKMQTLIIISKKSFEECFSLACCKNIYLNEWLKSHLTLVVQLYLYFPTMTLTLLNFVQTMHKTLRKGLGDRCLYGFMMKI